jgi:NAD-dependent dihydropyrimidine dehydrogenase PreA subunit
MTETKIDWSRCVGCGTCVEICPVGALELTNVNGKKKSKLIDQSICLECHECEFHCGYEAIKVYPPFKGQQPTDQAKVPMVHR